MGQNTRVSSHDSCGAGVEVTISRGCRRCERHHAEGVRKLLLIPGGLLLGPNKLLDLVLEGRPRSSSHHLGWKLGEAMQALSGKCLGRRCTLLKLR